jgi:AraC-like DNA-binding protein
VDSGGGGSAGGGSVGQMVASMSNEDQMALKIKCPDVFVVPTSRRSSRNSDSAPVPKNDPRLPDCALSSVAVDVGFGDLSYVNRAFRRRDDATPSEVRHARMTIR